MPRKNLPICECNPPRIQIQLVFCQKPLADAKTSTYKGSPGQLTDFYKCLTLNHHKNDVNDWITIITKELGDKKNSNQNLMTFEANSTVLITALEGYPVHPNYEVTLENTNQFDYMHFGFCLKGKFQKVFTGKDLTVLI